MAQTAWQASLLPASFRGAPFVVLDASVRGGRRGPEHEYPFRNEPYWEDLGRRGRRLRFTGYVVGDDAGAQAAFLISACEQKGPGPLVHPVYGFLQVGCSEFETEERWDKGRVIAFRFAFLEAGELSYPTNGADTQAASFGSAEKVDTAATSDLQSATGQVDIENIQISDVQTASSNLKSNATSGLPAPVAIGSAPQSLTNPADLGF